MATYSDTPVDYTTPTGQYGQVDIEVEDGETVADMIVCDNSGSVSLRLSRKELAALIASAAQALGALS